MKTDKSPLQSRAIKCAYQKTAAPIRTCPLWLDVGCGEFLNLGSAVGFSSGFGFGFGFEFGFSFSCIGKPFLQAANARKLLLISWKRARRRTRP